MKKNFKFNKHAFVSKLSEQKCGFRGDIKKIEGQAIIKQRLQELGFVSGEEIELQQILPFAGAMIVKVRGALLALRREEAACLMV